MSKLAVTGLEVAMITLMQIYKTRAEEVNNYKLEIAVQCKIWTLWMLHGTVQLQSWYICKLASILYSLVNLITCSYNGS